MLDLLNRSKETADGNVVFYDGFLYIICREIDGVDDFGYEQEIHSIDVKTLIPESGECYSLAEILMRYPSVVMVIHDNYTRGEVYRYGNHKVNGVKVWEKVGTTIGFI